MKKSFIVLVVLAFIGLTFWLYLTSTRYLQYTCPLNSLLIDSSVFSVDTTDEWGDMPEDQEYSSIVSRSFHIGESFGVQFISVMQTPEQAHDQFIDDINSNFRETKYSGSWQKPVTDFQAQFADEIEYACGNQGSTKVCVSYARYENYLVTLWFMVGENSFPVKDFISAMEAADTKMGSCVSDN